VIDSSDDNRKELGYSEREFACECETSNNSKENEHMARVIATAITTAITTAIARI
jgi:hypothetical protein